MECYTSRPVIITIKDQKPNFWYITQCRLMNATKMNKDLSTKAYFIVVNTIRVNQWRNTTTVIDWFKSLLKKTSLTLYSLTLLNFTHQYWKSCLIVLLYLLCQLPSTTQLLVLSTTQENLSISIKYLHG